MTPTPQTAVLMKPSEHVIDLSGFVEAAGGDEREARELLVLFIEQIALKAPKLSAAVVEANSVDAKLLAHSLAGAAATCGLMDFAQSLRELEMLASRNEMEAARAEFQKTSTLADAIAQAIKQKLGR